MKSNINSFLHFSINDVIVSFKWIHDKQPESIFEEPMFGKLREWHELYNLCVDCYVFEKSGSFELGNLQDIYWKELKENAGWLRLGWHQVQPGEITASLNEQISSAKRVHDLIVQKCGDRGFCRSLRLHLFAGDARLISHLHEMGVSTFLTVDADKRISYDMTEEQCGKLNEAGGLWDARRKILYKQTDIRLDRLGEEYAIEDALHDAHLCANRQPYKRSLEVFCHEWRFLKICDACQEFIGKVSLIPKRLYMNAAVRANEYIYFTDICSPFLYQMNIASRQIDILGNLSVECSGMKYASMTLYGSKIWMVPWEAPNILIYDLKNQELTEVYFPDSNVINGLLINNDWQNEYRKTVCCRERLWLLPRKGKALLCVDMENCSFCILGEFPEGICFDEQKSMMFKCMDLYNDWVYLFADGCSHNLKINANTGAIEIWNEHFRGDFGIKLDENKALLSPTVSGTPLRIYKDDLEIFEEMELPDCLWQEEKLYAFWYACRVRDDIYILPHEANGILKISDKNRISLVEYLDVEFYSMRPNKGFSGYDVMDLENAIWAIPYMGNQILQISPDGKISDVIEIEIPLEMFHRDLLQNKEILYETYWNTLEDFIKTNSQQRKRKITLIQASKEDFFGKN